ncbi:MAG: substrate-binding domain-containing protein [Rhizomicrobium sp.]
MAALTTIKLPIRDMGRMAAEKLLAGRKERKEQAEATDVIPTLVMRASAAAPGPVGLT